MDRQLIISTALAGLMALATSSGALAADNKKVEPKPNEEKCYGISKAGQNDCATPGGAHSCAKQSKTSWDARDWKYVPKGNCQRMGGKLTPPSS